MILGYFSFIFPMKHTLWVLIRSASLAALLTNTHTHICFYGELVNNICFYGELVKIIQDLSSNTPT